MFVDEEVDALGAKSTEALNRLYLVASRLNALVQDEDTAKNSEPGLNDSSPSGSV